MELRKTVAIFTLLLVGCGINPPKEVLIPVPTVQKIEKSERPILLSATAVQEEDRIKAFVIDLKMIENYRLELETLIDANNNTVPELPDFLQVPK